MVIESASGEPGMITVEQADGSGSTDPMGSSGANRPTSTTGVRSTIRPMQLSWWLFIVAVLVYAMVFVGGATRLTQSGLSIVSWKPVSGVVPPLSQADWDAEFDAYRMTPEFQKVNAHMELSEFKGIFWWEYAHRILGRIVGLALAVPFAWFLYRKAIPPGYGRRVALLIALVGLQGLIGWWMVASGLVDRPDVAHERLALHLMTALILLVALVWTALDLRALARSDAPVEGRPRRWVLPFTGLLVIQIVLGAFVAGLNAGHIYNTWPLMHGKLVPREIGDLSPVWSNVIDNPVTVQFLHRWMAVAVAIAVLAIVVVLHRAGAPRLAATFEAVLLLQFVLGVLTLINAVPLLLGLAHQVTGAALLVVTIVAAHWATGGARRGDLPDPTTSGTV